MSSEVVEHVPCVSTFVSQCADRVRVSFNFVQSVGQKIFQLLDCGSRENQEFAFKSE